MQSLGESWGRRDRGSESVMCSRTLQSSCVKNHIPPALQAPGSPSAKMCSSLGPKLPGSGTRGAAGGSVPRAQLPKRGGQDPLPLKWPSNTSSSLSLIAYNVTKNADEVPPGPSRQSSGRSPELYTSCSHAEWSRSYLETDFMPPLPVF